MLRRTVALSLVWLAVLTSQLHATAAEPREPVATDLSFPSNMAFAPDGRLFFAEKDTGDIRVIEDGRLLPEPVAHIDVLSSSEQGLLGLALDPAFDTEGWIYVYYSDPETRTNRLMRVRGSGDEAERQPLLDALTTEHGYHNGGDIVFGPDGTLFVAVGEVHEPERAQDPDNIGGKILRLNADGSVPEDNPMGAENPAYSMGHRNSFGLCVDPSTGDLWETENGPGTDDEVNLIEPGGNYGWPDQLGSGGAPSFVDPVLDFPEVIVPTGCAVWRGDLYFGAYGTDRLYRLQLPASSDASAGVVDDLGEGVTDLAVGPDGALYIATTDTIWRYTAPGTPEPSPAPAPGTLTPPTPSASVTSPPAENDGDGSNTALAIVAGVVLAAGLALRLRAGRKLRRDTSAPGDDGV